MVHTNNITVSIHKTNCKERLQNPAPRQSLKQQHRASSLGRQPCRTALCMLIIIQLRERCACSKLGFTFKDKNYQLQQPEAMRQHTQRARVGKMRNSYILAKYFLKEATDPPYPLPPLPISHSCPIWYVLVTAATLAKLIKIKLCVLCVACFLQGAGQQDPCLSSISTHALCRIPARGRSRARGCPNAAAWVPLVPREAGPQRGLGKHLDDTKHLIFNICSQEDQPWGILHKVFQRSQSFSRITR